MRSVTSACQVLGIYPREQATFDEDSTSDEYVQGILMQYPSWGPYPIYMAMSQPNPSLSSLYE